MAPFLVFRRYFPSCNGKSKPLNGGIIMKINTREYTSKIVTTASMSKEEAKIYGDFPEEIFREMAKIGVITLSCELLEDNMVDLHIVLKGKES